MSRLFNQFHEPEFSYEQLAWEREQYFNQLREEDEYANSLIEEHEKDYTSRIIRELFVFAWNKTYFINEQKFCPFEGSKLVLIIGAVETEQGISTHCSPCVGDVVADCKGYHYEVITVSDP